MVDNIILLIILSGCLWLMLIYLSTHKANSQPTADLFFNGSEISKIKVPNRPINRNRLSISFTCESQKLEGILLSVKIDSNYYTVEVNNKGAVSLVASDRYVTNLLVLDNLQARVIHISLSFEHQPYEGRNDGFKITLRANENLREINVQQRFKIPKAIYLAGSEKPGRNRNFKGVLKNIIVDDIPITTTRVRVHS